MRNELLLDVSESDYHADPCDVPSLSQSTAHTLISASPAHAYLEHPRLGGVRRKATSSMGRGSLLDAILLGGTSRIVAVHASDWKTKAAQTERDEAREAGKIPALDHELASAFEIADIVRPKLARLGCEFTGGHAQVSIFWIVQTQFGPIQCRGRLDYLRAENLILDLKTTEKRTPPQRMGRHFCDFGYEIQAAAYTQAVETVDPGAVGRVRFRNVVVETVAPYCVTVAEPDAQMLDLGQRRWSRACETWAQCLHDNYWPEYSDQIVRVSPPAYEVFAESEAEAS